MSFPAEFMVSKGIILEELDDFLDKFSLIPGNHDRYTLGEVYRQHFNDFYSSWMISDIPSKIPGLTV